jgi:hypothetical protein
MTAPGDGSALPSANVASISEGMTCDSLAEARLPQALALLQSAQGWIESIPYSILQAIEAKDRHTDDEPRKHHEPGETSTYFCPVVDSCPVHELAQRIAPS